MPVLITDPTVDKALKRHAVSAAVPSKKLPLATAIIRAAIAAADAEGVNVETIVRGLQERSARTRNTSAA